ncbi:hypothetical protein SLS55_002184 [Diplodia seriata]|uniref:Reticulocyte-binding protein 2-like protein a n=1 Tax=Diplodia seriata TaxID=420778 RepID=A0ABR3CSD7_9PEZI
MGVPTHRAASVADNNQGERLSAFLQRINFSLDSASGSAHAPSSASLNGAVSDNITFGSFKLPPLQTKTNTLQEAPPSKHSDKFRHKLPVYALAQTLRASSIGATMAPGIPSEAGALGWSKYAPGSQSDGSSGGGLNQRTAETIARQAEIDARLSKLRARREPATEQRDETRRLELIAAQKAADDKHARVKAEKKKQVEEETIRLETERLKREKDETERVKREEAEAERRRFEKEEAERIQHEKEEAARLQREKEEAERLKREKEEAERLQREKEEAGRLKREKEEAERLQREKEEAERIQREKEEAERLQREKEEAERLQREKEEAEEAALRASLYDRIDEMEEDGLSKTQAMQMELQRSIEQSTLRQEKLTKDIAATKDEIVQTQELLKGIQSEFQDLQDEESSITAKLEADTKECAELQTVSERIIERASHMRKEVENKTLRSLDMIAAFEVPEKTPQEILLAPLKNGSTTNSQEATGVQDVKVKVEHDAEVKIEHSSPSSNGMSQSEVAPPKPGPVENGKTEKPVFVEPASSQQKKNSSNGLENKFQFDEWPTQGARPFGGKWYPMQMPLTVIDLGIGAQKRLIKLTNLPISSSVASIQALVWKGRIEKFEYTPGNSFAWVLFMRGQDCEKYFADTANGIQHPDGNRTIWVEMGDPVTVNETLRGLYDAGHTRCVRAVGADEDWGEAALVKLASAKKRKLERIVNGANPKGLRVIEFRFTNIIDAGRFKIELQNDIDWEHCNVYFGTDPCEDNTGVHLGIQ